MLYSDVIPVWAALGLLAGGQEAADFPLRPGARWVYVQDGREAMILDAVEASAAGPEQTVTVRVRGGSFFWHSGDIFLSVGPRGLRSLGGRLTDENLPDDPPRLLLPPRLEKGAAWESADIFFRAEVRDVESVTVPAGTFRAWRIDYVLLAHLGTEDDFRAWYAPGTGFVRLEYWQSSGTGGKKPLARPYRRELARFEPRRRAVPVEIPPLPAADRKIAEEFLVRLTDPAVDVRLRAAADLFGLGRGVTPMLREALEKTADPETRGRLREVLDRFPKLEFSAHLVREKGKVGEPLPVRFALRNLSPEALRIVPSIDGSEVGRFPRYLLTILDDQGVEQRPPKRTRFCGHLNRLEGRDFVRLEPGEEFDPLGPGTFGHALLSWTPLRPGVCTLDAVYDATGRIPEDWQGSGRMGQDALWMLEAMPRGRIEAKRLTIVVEP
jgi:hypothetical protein